MREGLHQFYCVLVSFEKADAHTRGQFSLFYTDIPRIQELAAKYGVSAPFALSTCNRTELYGFSDNHEGLYELFTELSACDPGDLSPYITILRSQDALRHLFRVAGGLESQILGDFEIVGQIKTWANHFKKQGALEAFSERWINTALKVSKEIKANTSLSDGTASVSYAAVNYILQHVNQPSKKNITLFGLGKIGRNTCQNLRKHIDELNLTVINRSPEKVEDFADKLNLTVLGLDDLKPTLESTDVLIVATGGDHPLINANHIPGDRPLLIIDLSVPSNVCDGVSGCKNVRVVDVDDLTKVVDDTLQKRTAAIPEAEALVNEYLEEFMQWVQQREFVPYIQAFQDKLTFLLEDQAKKAQKDSDKQLNQRFIQKLTNRFAKYVIDNPHKAEMAADLISEVFVLDELSPAQ